MRGLGEFQRNQMKHRDARIFALCQHSRSGIDILEQITTEPFQPPDRQKPPEPTPPQSLISEPALPPGRVDYSQKEVRTALGFGNTALWRYIRDGKIPAVKLGSRTMIPAEGLQDSLATLPRVRPRPTK